LSQYKYVFFLAYNFQKNVQIFFAIVAPKVPEFIENFQQNPLLTFCISTLVTAIISGFIGGKISLYLNDRKERREAQTRFTNRLKSLACELKINFRYAGNNENPFLTKALENLVYNEPLIHHHQTLFEKAQNCLNIALLPSTSKRPVQKPGEGQQLMKDLSEHLASQFKITAPDLE